jgi:drug/metabolite transporter (DMT)-like permease
MLPIFKPWEIMPEISISLILALGGVIIFGTVIAYSFFLEGVHLIGASKASIVSSIEPVSATVIKLPVWREG